MKLRRTSAHVLTICIARQGKRSLLLAIFWALKWPLLAPVFPYLVLIASQLAQPFLISTILNYVGSTYDGGEQQRNIGYGLIAAYGFVYLSIAVGNLCNSGYRHTLMFQRLLRLGVNIYHTAL